MRCSKLRNRLLFVAFLFPCFVWAQATADCSGAIVVCEDQTITLEGGPGALDFNNPNNELGDCHLTGETESVWLYFRFRADMPPGSILELTIDPIQDGEIDYDFSIFPADSPCDNLGSPIRCSYAWVFSNSQFSCGFCPLTGLGNGETDVSEGPFGNGYLAPLVVDPGQGFYMFINEFFDDAALSEGFHISFGGSAAPYLDCGANPNCEEMVADAGRDSTVCSGDIPFQLIGSATFATGYETYTWTGAQGEEAFLDDPHSPHPAVTFPDGFSGAIEYILEVRSDDCVHYDTLRLAVLATPPFSLTGPASFCSGETVTLTASPGFDSYLWSDNSTGQSLDVSTGGAYSITVAVAGNNCAITREMDVAEYPSPQVEIAGDTALCAGDTIFLDAGRGYDIYNWQSGAIGRFLPVTQAGAYVVEVVDTNGCSGTGRHNIIEVALPDPEIAGPDGLCPDVEANLSVFPIYSAYLWSTGDFGPQLNTSVPGQYAIEVWDEYGCRGTDTLDIAALPGVDPHIFGPDTICYGASTPLAVSPVFDTYLWSSGSAAPSILADATGQYSITVTNAEGCSGADTLNLLELPPLNVSLNILGSTVLCTGDTIFLQATPGFESYVWQNGAVGPVLPASSGGAYMVEVTDTLGCTAIASLALDEYSPPRPVVAGPAGLCPGQADTLEVGAYVLYQWSDGSETAQLPIDSPGAYAVTVTDSNGCVGAGALDVAAYANPQPSISGPAALCEGSAAVLFVGGGPFAGYQWQDNSSRPQLPVSAGGAYSVTVSNSDGCIAADTFQVDLLSLPVIDIPSELSFCENETLAIDAGPGFASYSWSTGANSQVIEVGLPGAYSVAVTDSSGCRNSLDINVAANPIPEPEVAGNLTFCMGSSTTLSLQPSQYEFINWSTGGVAPTETFDTPGEFSVMVADSNGCVGHYAFIIQELGPTPVAITGDTLICAGETAVLDAGGGYESYLWSTGLTDSTLTVSSGGLYTVTVTNARGCEGYDTLSVRLQPLPAVALPDTMILCEDGILALDAGPGIYAYLWSNGQETASILIDAPGVFEVTAADSVGCVARDSVDVVENEVPSPQIDGSLRLCPGASSILTVDQTYQAYQWSTGDTVASVLIAAPGFYTLTVTDANGCLGTANILVNAAPAPQVSITGPQEICEGAVAVLDAGVHGSYLWSNGFDGQQLSTMEEGLYNVIVTNIFGCQDTAWAGLRVLPLPDPGLPGEALLCEGDTIILEGAPGLGYYLWSNGSQEPALAVSAGGAYTLAVSDGACSGQDTIIVVEQPAPQPEVAGSAQVCPGDTVTLEVLGNWQSISWPNGASGSTLAATVPGIYAVTVEDSLGCFGTGEGLLEHFDVTPPAISGDGGFCPGETATIGVGPGYAGYAWNNGGTGPSITVSIPMNYTVTVTDANGCTGQDSQPVYAYGQPQTFVAGDTAFCAGDSALIFAFGAFAGYEWSTGDTGKFLTVGQAGAYEVTVTDFNGCRAVAGAIIRERPLPQPSILGGQFCAGGSATLFVEEGFEGYLWENGAGSPTIVVDSAGIYGLTVTDNLGCTGSVSVTVAELPLPEPEIIGGTPICLGVGDSATLTVAGSYESISWNTGASTASIHVDTTGLYSVSVTDVNGCRGDTAFMLEALPAPSLEVLGGRAFCQDGSTTLTAVSGGDSVRWSTGAISLQVIIDQPGIYSITAFGDNGCQTADTIQVDEILPVMVNAGATRSIDCREQPVQLGDSANPGQGLIYEWSGPGIDDSNRYLPMPVVSEPGLYSLVARDSAYGCISPAVEVVVQDLRYEPVVEVAVADTLDCSTPTVTASGQGSAQGPTITYQWYNGASVPIPGASALDLSVSQAGPYTLVVTDTATGCTASAGAEVAGSFSYPLAEAGPGGVLTCEVLSLTLAGRTDPDTAGLRISWSTPEGNIVEGGDGLSPLVDAPGAYVLSVTDLASGCRAEDTVVIEQDIEAPIADAGQDQEIDCTSQEVTLDGSGSSQGPGYRYEWRSEAGVPIEGTLSPAVGQPGTFFLTVTNLANGCSSIDEAVVEEAGNYLTGMQLSARGPLCSGGLNGNIIVTAVSGGTEPFLFSLNGGPFSSSRQFLNLGAGIYDVVVQDAAGCEYGLQANLEDGNDVLVELGDDRFEELGKAFTLQALTNLLSEEIRDVFWSSPADTFPCIDVDCLIKELNLETSTRIRATVVDTNGCSSYDELTIFLDRSRGLYIPNAFSPNGDGYNDFFTVYADKDVAFVEYLMVMNRWGGQVFLEENFPPNVPMMGWDGKLDGQPLDPAVFTYVAKVKFVDGISELYKGDLSLLR